MAARDPYEPDEIIVDRRRRNRGLLLGFGVVAAVLLLVLVAFLVAGPGQSGGTNRTNVNVVGQGQQPPAQVAPPGNVQINVNGTGLPATPTRPPTVTLRPLVQVIPPAPSPAVEVLVVTATAEPSSTPTQSPTTTPTLSPSTTPTLTPGFRR